MNSRRENRSNFSFYSQNYNQIFFGTFFLSICGEKISTKGFLKFCKFTSTSSNLSADNFQKILDLDGSTAEPVIWSGDTGQRIACFDSCQLIIILMWNGLSWAPKVATKCESEHWYACGANGRSAGSRFRVTWLPNFLGWVDLLTHSALLARATAPL